MTLYALSLPHLKRLRISAGDSCHDSGFDSSKIDNEVTRVIISENTLEHYRSDASRRRTSVENDETVVRKDYSVQPRFSQALHPKGHKGDVSYNSTDHSGDGA